jgi:O-antigen biosynthesis protein
MEQTGLAPARIRRPATVVTMLRRIYRALRLFIASPRGFMECAMTATVELQRELDLRTVTSKPKPVSEDLPFVLRRRIKTTVDTSPRLNVLIPGLQEQHLSGGPNTAMNLAYRLATRGVPVRFVSTDFPHDSQESLLEHCRRVTGLTNEVADVTFASWENRAAAVIGRTDMLLATAWWTAQLANRLLPYTKQRQFVYLIQDYEPGFYKWSPEYALAQQTYSMPVVPVVCGRLLAEYLRSQRQGRFSDRRFADSSLCFEPAIDRTLFHCGKPDAGRPRRLLFYARPKAPRNLFDLGLLALKRFARANADQLRDWELWFIGDRLAPRDLGAGVLIRQYPWLDYGGYAELLRTGDVGLSLMLSPHTSYPPLEMAACGASVVTNVFANKTAERLAEYSLNIIPVEPSVEEIAVGLAAAVDRTPDQAAREAGSLVGAPSSWEESFAPVLDRLIALWHDRSKT